MTRTEPASAHSTAGAQAHELMQELTETLGHVVRRPSDPRSSMLRFITGFANDAATVVMDDQGRSGRT
jgi:hypothetical protein